MSPHTRGLRAPNRWKRLCRLPGWSHRPAGAAGRSDPAGATELGRPALALCFPPMAAGSLVSVSHGAHPPCRALALVALVGEHPSCRRVTPGFPRYAEEDPGWPTGCLGPGRIPSANIDGCNDKSKEISNDPTSLGPGSFRRRIRQVGGVATPGAGRGGGSLCCCHSLSGNNGPAGFFPRGLRPGSQPFANTPPGGGVQTQACGPQ